MQLVLFLFLALFLQERSFSTGETSFSIAPWASQDASHRHAPLTETQKARIHAVAQQAREVVSSLPSEEKKSQLSAGLAEILAKSGDMQAAREVANSIKGDRERMDAMHAIAKAQAENGDFAGGWESASSIKAETNRAAAILDVIAAQAGAKDFAGALQNASKISDQPAVYTSALVKIAEEKTNANQKGEALRILEKARESASAVTSCSFEAIEGCRISILSEIATAQLHAGDAAAGQKTLDLAQQGLAQMSQEERFVSVSQMAAAEQELGHPERAKELLSDVPGMAGQLADMMSTMQQVSEAAMKGDMTSARNAVDSISNPEQRATAQLMIAEAYAQSGDAKSALEALRTLKPLSQRAQFAGTVAESLAQKRKFPEAEEALKIGMAAAETEENDAVIGDLLGAAVKVHASAGDVEGARTMAELIKDREKRAWAARDAARILGSKKKDEDVLKWSAAENSALVKANLLLGVADGIALQESAGDKKE
jgi:hypothetical protein